MKRPDEMRRPYVTDPDLCRVCLHGINGCPSAEHLAAGNVCACIGYKPSMVRV